MCRLAALRQQLEERLEYARAAEPPEPLPYAVPVAKFAGERTPGYTVYGEVVDGFQEFTVVMPRLSPVRLRSIKHVQHDRPIALRHCCQHVRLPSAGHAVIRTKPDSGIRQKCMSGIPSTRPKHVYCYLLIDPDWLKGTSGLHGSAELGGYAEATVGATSDWYAQRLADLRLIEV